MQPAPSELAARGKWGFDNLAIVTKDNPQLDSKLAIAALPLPRSRWPDWLVWDNSSSFSGVDESLGARLLWLKLLPLLT